MKNQVLTESQINQVNHVLKSVRKEFDKEYSNGCRYYTKSFELFNGAITLRVLAFDDFQDNIFSARSAYYNNEFGGSIEVFDYNEQDLIDMWGDDFEDAMEEIAELAMCA